MIRQKIANRWTILVVVVSICIIVSIFLFEIYKKIEPLHGQSGGVFFFMVLLFIAGSLAAIVVALTPFIEKDMGDHNTGQIDGTSV